MLLVVALGGNALLQRGQSPDAETQRANVRTAVESIAELAHENDLVITHGNGPQVGLLALQSESLGSVPGYPLDILVASPIPRRILGLAAIRILVTARHIVVCAGGGGIPARRSGEECCARGRYCPPRTRAPADTLPPADRAAPGRIARGSRRQEGVGGEAEFETVSGCAGEVGHPIIESITQPPESFFTR